MDDNTINSKGNLAYKLSREQNFFDKSVPIRWLIYAIFVLSTFAMLHFREVHVDILELNSTAPRYIVAQVDFEFPDEEAKSILKQEVLRDIGRIYKVSEKDIRSRHAEFEKSLIHNEEWRRRFPDAAFKETYHLTDLLAKGLIQARFTDPRTLEQITANQLSTNDYYVYTPPAESRLVTLPLHIWDKIEMQAFPKAVIGNEMSQYVIDFFKDKQWSIQEDIPSQRALRKRMQATVLDQYTFVSAGNRIIDQGERVTSRHIAMLQAMKQTLNEKRNLWNPATILGNLLMAILLTAICIFFCNMNYPTLLSSNYNSLLLVTIIVLTYLFAKIVEFFLLTVKGNLFEVIHYPLFLPFAAILVRYLINAGVATFVTGFLAVILTTTLAFDEKEFMLINLAAAIVAILATRSLYQRKDIFIVCLKSWLVAVAGIVAIHFYENNLLSAAAVDDIMSTAIFMIVTSILVVGLLPLFESTFGIMTDALLMEYMDPNQELLRRLSIEAPGTYQHSLVVGSLSELAAAAIGANGLFCRVATLFHDIGKMTTAQYFTENQQGMNIHQLLTPKESAQVIMAHVSEGVALARKAALPEQFIDIIKEHHGTTLVYYFYCKQLELVGGNKAEVDERDFRYVGPKPRTKESGIIMIADSLEAASRSLEKLDEPSLRELVNRLIAEKAADGQFDECPLTFQDMTVIKDAMVKALLAAGHSRVKYPMKDTSMRW